MRPKDDFEYQWKRKRRRKKKRGRRKKGRSRKEPEDETYFPRSYSTFRAKLVWWRVKQW